MSHKNSSSLLIVGAGGHGRVVADAALDLQHWTNINATDADASKCVGELLSGVPLLGGEQLQMDGSVVVHIAIGNNYFREKESIHWGRANLVKIVHAHSRVSKFSTVESGCFVAAGAIVAAATKLGFGVIVNHAAVIDHDSIVDEFTHIAPHATLGGGVHIGKRVLIGSGAVILPGCKICDDVTIGAGAVVRHDIQAPGVYVGVPVRKLSS